VARRQTDNGRARGQQARSLLTLPLSSPVIRPIRPSLAVAVCPLLPSGPVTVPLTVRPSRREALDGGRDGLGIEWPVARWGCGRRGMAGRVGCVHTPHLRSATPLRTPYAVTRTPHPRPHPRSAPWRRFLASPPRSTLLLRTRLRMMTRRSRAHSHTPRLPFALSAVTLTLTSPASAPHPWTRAR
jgi:hypothetical protein